MLLTYLHIDFSRGRSGGLVFPSISEFPTVKYFGIVNKVEIDALLECFCFFNDPVDVGNLISGSFLKSACASGSSQFTYC